jgi:hypothetical protein
MKRFAVTVLCLFTMCALAGAQTPMTVAGTWQMEAPQTGFIVLKVDGEAVNGTVSAAATDAGTAITEGMVRGDTIAFSVQFPNGGRTVKFNGTIEGDAIRFRREVVVPKGAAPGGNAILGANGPSDFTVYRLIETSVWRGTVRNAPTPRNQNPNPNPRAVTLSAKKAPSPHWRWTGTKTVEIRMFTIVNQGLELLAHEVTGDQLAFSYKQGGDVIKCRLARQTAGPFQGTCQSDGGNQSLFIDLTPPASAAAN